LLGEFAHGDQATRILVEPLSPEAVASLAAPYKVDGDDLYRKTNGNPFFVTEALASPGAEVPDTVRDAVLTRAARLDSGAREVLEAVAVAPPHVELWLLEALVADSAVRLEAGPASGMLAHAAGPVPLARPPTRPRAPPPPRAARACGAARRRGGPRAARPPCGGCRRRRVRARVRAGGSSPGRVGRRPPRGRRPLRECARVRATTAARRA